MNDEMRAYYDRRAAEYDDWWLGTGLFLTNVFPLPAGAESEDSLLIQLANAGARERYGDPLPEEVRRRLDDVFRGRAYVPGRQKRGRCPSSAAATAASPG